MYVHSREKVLKKGKRIKGNVKSFKLLGYVVFPVKNFLVIRVIFTNGRIISAHNLKNLSNYCIHAWTNHTEKNGRNFVLGVIFLFR